MITRGFRGNPSRSQPRRLPPGQSPTRGFPVLSAGPTPRTPLDEWTFALEAEDGTTIASWTWEEFRALGPTEVTVDIHCVTRWSKFDTDWRGVSVDRILEAAGLEEPPSPFVMAFCDGGYTTNLPVEDLLEHLAGQHADVRLTAPDGYRAERSYSIASPPEAPALELTVERLEDGEVSSFLTGELQPGDTIQLRGPTDLLSRAGQPSETIRTERFGPTGA